MSDQQDQLHALRHSLAHIMATAVQHLWPEVKLGIGPVVENGFYYDIDLGPETKISEADFAKIEAEMKKIIAENQPFERFEQSIDEAIAWAESAKQPYKAELLNDLKRAGTTVAKDLSPDELGTIAQGDSQVESVSFYKNGDFTDLCRGPHVDSTGSVGAFKLMRVAGAYWRGKESNAQMQRLYGLAFESQEALDAHLHMLEEAKARDHRKLGSELDLFVFSELVGPGLPLWTPRGTIVRRQLDNFVQEMRDRVGFQEVSIPHITKKDLYEKSGHWAKFSDELFRITTREGHEFAMKPMNCPHHTQIYDSRQRSYRDLPIRYRETTTCYRDEQSGELNGLSRVRAFAQDDAHVFCRSNQIRDEINSLWNIVENFYAAFGMELRLRVSTHDPSNMAAYLGDPKVWESSVEDLKEIAKAKVGDDYELGVGEAAFYGPKLDFMAKDAIGRTWQVATIQLDFNQPEGFDLVCINEQSERERIVMIHCAIMGSLERFMSIMIEHTAGKFPVWLAPEQVRIASVNQEPETLAFVERMLEFTNKLGIRAYHDDSNESVGKKIRAAEVMKVPYTIVVGAKEIESEKATPRIRKDLETKPASEHTIEELLQNVAIEAAMRTRQSSL
jgi:threonyl-tRNA synthetase